jgi:hypothetical protein
VKEVAGQTIRDTEPGAGDKTEAQLYNELVLAEVARYHGPIWSYEHDNHTQAQLIAHIEREHGIKVPAGLDYNKLRILHSIAHQSEDGQFITSLIGTRPLATQTTVVQPQRVVRQSAGCPGGVCPNQSYSYGYSRNYRNRDDD